MRSGKNSSSCEPARNTRAEQLHQSASGVTPHNVRNDERAYVKMDLLRLQNATYYAQPRPNGTYHNTSQQDPT
jgi:hypothetical protein